MTVDTIEATWESYRRDVLPADAPVVQRVECRRAFYAGFHAMLQVCLALGSDELPEDLGVIALTALNVEADRFKQAVLEGRA